MVEQTVELPVYNLEFPPHCHEFTVFGYRFRRISEYPSAVKQLSRSVSFIHEFELPATTGRNILTAVMYSPRVEKRAVLPWNRKNLRAVFDVQLLLSLFTCRDIAVLPADLQYSDITLITDPREFQFGRALGVAIPYRASSKVPDEAFDAGFITGINQTYELIRSRNWQSKYYRGYLLLLAKEAFKYQTLERAFLNSVTIWEHLYRILNPKGKNNHSLARTSLSECLQFLLFEFGFWRGNKHNALKSIQKYWSDCRNNVAHFGEFPSKISRRDAVLFVELTVHLVAKVLNLNPKNTTNTKERLESLFRRRV